MEFSFILKRGDIAKVHVWHDRAGGEAERGTEGQNDVED